MPDFFGSLIGAAIDRQDGDSGIKGAIAGTVVESAIRFVAPILATYALGWAVQVGAGKAWQAMLGDDPVADGSSKSAA